MRFLVYTLALLLVLVGRPGLSLPIGLTRDGLPVGIELDAPSGRDHALLAIGLACEASRPAMPAPRL